MKPLDEYSQEIATRAVDSIINRVEQDLESNNQKIIDKKVELSDLEFEVHTLKEAIKRLKGK